MTKIGVIADSHKWYKRAIKAIEFLCDEGAEYFIHAGDIVSYEVLEYLKDTKKKTYIVFGNNDKHLYKYADDFNIKFEPYNFKLDDTRFKLMHKPYFLVPNYEADIIIYGHTHSFDLGFTNGKLFLNPGEVCARNKAISECVLLEISNKKIIVNRYQRNLKEKHFVKSVKGFNR